VTLLGSGTGKGVASVIEEFVKELGSLILVAAAFPFSWKGHIRTLQAGL